MPFFVDPVTLSVGYILAGLERCPAPPKKVNVNVTLKTNLTPSIDTVTSQQLAQSPDFHLPDSSTSTDGHWMVGGLTKSQIQSSYKMEFQGYQTSKGKDVCLSLKNINYEIVYAPIVYIASDFKLMGCRYSATVAHEKRHVDTDISTINQYIPEMKKMIEQTAQSIGSQGPFPSTNMKFEQEKMMQQISASLKPVIDNLINIRRQRQAQIDTKENYLRDTALCPGQFPVYK